MSRVERPNQSREGGASKPSFVELPTGIFTAAGTWFHVSVDDLRSYAGEVLDRTTIEDLFASAESVLRAPQTLATWVLIATLMIATPVESALATLVVFFGWSVLGPGLVLPGILRILRVLETVWLQAVAYVAGLSILGNSGAITAVSIGLAGFVLLRWGVVSRLAEPLVRALRSRLYALPHADQALRAVIIRFALRERVSLPQLDTMEERMMEIGQRRPHGTSPESQID